MDESVRICARLLREGAVRRAEVPELDRPDVRNDVESRLEAVGLMLATSAYSGHVGLRLSPRISHEPDFDAASNLGLRSDALALLVIAWARLVLQKRTATETRSVPGQGALLPEDRAAAAAAYAPTLRTATLEREFRRVLGSGSNIRRLVSQLRRLGFLAGRGEIIEPGPLLELGIDGERMVGWIRREVLASLTAEREAPEEAEESPEAGLLRVIRDDCHGRASMRDLVQATHAGKEKLRAMLRALIEQKRVRKEGERAQTVYQVVD